MTLHQPYASLIAQGYKKIETRSWRPPAALIGQPLAIHAGQKLIIPKDTACLQAVSDCLGEDWAKQLPRGQILAIVRLNRAVAISADRQLTAGREALFGNYHPGHWAWYLDNVQLLRTPLSLKGRQGLWNWQITETPP